MSTPDPRNGRLRLAALEALRFLSFSEDDDSALAVEMDSHRREDEPDVGACVDGFRLEAELGRGGMGIVFRARQLSFDRVVALKLSALHDSAEREARLLASVEHPGIVRVYRAGAVPGWRYIAMALVDGHSLDRVIRGAPADALPHPGHPDWIGFLVGILHDTAAALGAIHAKGIVHCDVKPTNILIDRDRRPILVDFGLARGVVDEASRPRSFAGTPRYASPEQVCGDVVTPAADVFSFGATAFVALTGLAGSEGKDRALVRALCDRQRRWPRDLRIPRALRAVIDTCLERSPADRPADGRAMADQLARFRVGWSPRVEKNGRD